MTNEKLQKVLKAHEHWIKEDIKGWENMRANLRGADLGGADLRNADLRNADLRGADLRGANLWGADLWGADLGGANLGNADLRGADLGGANLGNADLRNADLRNADLGNAKLWCADLWGADLMYAKNINIPLACPSEGSFIAWKKCEGRRLVKLFIYKDSKRSSATTNKCRTDKAKVLSIVNIDTGEQYKEAFSNYDHSFIYRVGEIVKVDDFDENRFNECASGIHFFVDKESAINY